MSSFGYQWHGKQWTDSGCAGTYNPPGWYAEGSYTPIATSYLNPATGKPYTPTELGGTTTSTGAVPSTSQVETDPGLTGGTPAGYIEGQLSPHIGVNPGLPTSPVTTPGTTTPSVSTPTAITPPAVTPAPAYEISPEQQAWEEQYGGELSDWVGAGGYGIPEETQAQMIQQQTDSLKAGEAESIRVMKNNMERRGITNSGFIFANEQAIRSNTSKAIAGAIADVQIKSALMKMASFETAMGQAAQFLGYLSEQSQLQYAPGFATWQAEQEAKLQTWQAQIDIYKMEINQAYQQQNMQLQAQLQSQLNQQQNAFEMELAEMEIEANNQIAQAQGTGNLIGTGLGILASITI